MQQHASMGVATTESDVPNEIREELAARAGRAGQSLQDVITRALTRVEATGSRIDRDAILEARDAERR